jgi:antitoxin component YwqK of YwqJK toxin-antitoxin module
MKEILKFKNLLFLSIFILLSSCGKTIDWDDDKEYITISFNSEGLTKVLSYKGLPFNGELVEYFDDEKTQLKERIDYKEGLKDGLSEVYNKNGQLEENVTYKDGEEDEKVKYTYYGYGLLKEKKSFKDGKKNGPFEWYNRGGQLVEKRTWKDGKEDGQWEEFFYHPNGQLMWKETYKDGQLDGLYEEYHPNGQLSEKGTYKDGIEVGQSEYYDENGKIREPYETISIEVFDKSMEEGGKD